MDLKEFVAESLKEVIDGVREAQAHARKHGARVCPPIHRKGQSNTAYYVTDSDEEKVSFVKYDVALSAEDSTKGDAGGKLNIKIASIGAEVETAEKNSSISRLQFELPVVWPMQHDY